MAPRIILFGLGFLTSCCVHAYSGCAPEGPLLPRPKNLEASAIIQTATAELQATIDRALTGKIRAGWSVENTSFSIGLVTVDEQSQRPTWEYHHRGSTNINGTNDVNGDTQYLIGSISKLISSLLVLHTGIELGAPITEYLPQLKDESSIIQWEDITLASLADHLSGIPPNYGFSEFYLLAPLLEQLGFPPLSPDDYAECGIIGLNGPCSEDQLLNGMLSAHPITATYQRPTYSQVSFTLLSYAMKASLHKSYTELLDEHIIQPLGLNNTGASPGNSSLAIIPPIDNSWGSDYGDNAPGGGLYSSLNDLSKLIQTVLNKTILGTETEVREWLKPHSSTSSPHTLVGRPWEIFRSTNLTPAHPHTIDIYAKNGGAYGYTAQMAVIDQYGIGIAILTAGPAEAYRILYDAMLSVFLPAVEEETRLQAQKYTGSFVSSDSLVALNTSIDDGPGIKIDGLTRNGSDILTALSEFYTQALPQFGTLSTDFRIFPTELSEQSVIEEGGENLEVVRGDWRIGLDFLPNMAESSRSALPGQGAMKEFCVSWQTADWFYYGSQSVDRIVFVEEKGTGRVLGVEVPFLRARLNRY